MYKLILITVITILCSSIVAQAQPLPLIPKEQAANQATATTASTTVNTTASTNKETSQATKQQADKTTTQKTTETTNKTASETTAQPSSAGNNDLASLIESGHKKWFDIKDKAKGQIERLSTALEGDKDYRSKAKRGYILLSGKELLNEASTFSADSIRGAIDALMGWDFTHSTNR